MSQQVHHVETIPTGSELTALVLESKLVKELQPIFNRMLRRVSAYAMLIGEESDGYMTIAVKQGSIDTTTDLDRIYGLYETRTKAKRRLDEITRQFELCPKLMGLEKATGACFSYSLGRCRGACIGKESAELYNRRFELEFEPNKLETWPYESPIAVPVNDQGERVIINNWTIIGYTDEQGEPVFEVTEPTFDLDEYKIIQRFVRQNSLFIARYEI